MVRTKRRKSTLLGRFFTVPFEPTLTERTPLQSAVHVINVVPPCKGIKDGRTPDAVDLSKIQVIADLLDDLSLAQYMTVMHAILKAVNVCLYFQNPPPPTNYLGPDWLGPCSATVLSPSGKRK